MSQFEKHSVLEMLGEFLREVAVLVLVFVPLETWRGPHGDRLQFVLLLSGTALVAITSLAAGIIIERKRP